MCVLVTRRLICLECLAHDVQVVICVAYGEVGDAFAQLYDICVGMFLHRVRLSVLYCVEVDDTFELFYDIDRPVSLSFGR